MTDPDRRLSERLHGIADHSMSIIIGNMVQEMITELKMRESPGYPGHISFTLTDEERWAVSVAMGIINEGNYGWPDGTTPPQDTLRGLLERTKGGER